MPLYSVINVFAFYGSSETYTVLVSARTTATPPPTTPSENGIFGLRYFIKIFSTA